VALYTADSKERVRDAVDMVDLVSQYTELRRAGPSRYQGLCPFHDERTPSFGINPAEKVYHCFGCGAGGDAFRFVMEREGLQFKEALEFLADRYGVELELEEEDASAAERRKQRERLLELLERTATFYVRYLWDSEEAAGAREYLTGRGLDEGTLREFRVGYAPSAWDTVLLASRRAGFSNRELHEAGLAQRGKGEGRIYDRFRRRIMFPLCDARGRVLGFGARALGADQQPKYVNSSDNDVYHKGKHLFGADIARVHATKAGSVIVAEGYTDVIALHQAGLRNTVGLMGTALTADQVGELARLANVVALALDADSAGQEAMVRAARLAEGRNLELRVVPLPAGSDPAELVAAQGADAMRSLVDGSVPFVRFRVERELAGGDLDSAEGKDRVIDALRPAFATLRPSAMREDLIKLVAERTELAPSLVSGWLAAGAPAVAAGGGGGVSQHERRPVADAGPSRSLALDAAARAERDFLAQCLALPTAGRQALASLDAGAAFTSPLARRAAQHLAEHFDAPADAIPDGDDEFASLIAELVVRAGQHAPSRAALDAETLKLELAHIDRQVRAAQAAGAGDVAALAERRTQLQEAVDQAIDRAMGETVPND
jgi:DNA primase